mgnify:CR=1 FL=1
MAFDRAKFSRRVKLEQHLKWNFVPSLEHMVDVAEKAIDLADQGEWGMRIDVNGKLKEVSEIIEDLHLDDFVE